MAIYLSKTIVAAFPLQVDHALYLKSFALSTAILLGALQVESILYVIYSNVMFINELHSKREDREADADI
jgi:1,4-dihydroxy-2-naphthoate octaprenyltransferase